MNENTHRQKKTASPHHQANHPAKQSVDEPTYSAFFPQMITPHRLIQLQATIGNQAVQRWLTAQQIQRKPDDYPGFDDFSPFPDEEGTPLGNAELTQAEIYDHLLKAKTTYEADLKNADTPELVKQVKDAYHQELDIVHADADLSIKRAENKSGKRKLNAERDQYAVTMRLWGTEIRQLTGKTDHDAIEKAYWNLYLAERFNDAIFLVINAYGFSTAGAEKVLYYEDIGKVHSPDQDDKDNVRGKTLESDGKRYVLIGPLAYQNFPVFVHTVAHELEHLRQLVEGVPEKPLREFLSEAVEIIGDGLPRVEIIHFFASAKEALDVWQEVSVEQQIKYWDRFEEVRTRVISELERVGFDEFKETISGYKAVQKPAAVE